MKLLPALLVFLSILMNSCGMLMHNAVYNKYSGDQLKSFEKFAEEKAKESLIHKANETVQKKFSKITDKSILANSGDKNDFHSRAIYYWPKKNLSKTAKQDDSWEFVDGKINQESLKETDHENYYEMLTAIKRLALAYHYSNESKYAEKCVSLINDWFINPKTRMNPHFKYAQAIPGLNDGTSSGIIDSRGIVWILDSIELIKSSEYWTDDMASEFHEWSSDLLDWLLTSYFGKVQSKKINNHGSIYFMQVIKLSSYLGMDNTAMEKIIEFRDSTLVRLIEPDGRQPSELVRADGHMYSVFNMSSCIEIALLAETYNLNLWNYSVDGSGTIEDAVDFLVESYMTNKKKDFKKEPNIKNLIKIIPKANSLSNGRYDELYKKLLNEIGYIDLTQIYYVI